MAIEQSQKHTKLSFIDKSDVFNVVNIFQTKGFLNNLKITLKNDFTNNHASILCICTGKGSNNEKGILVPVCLVVKVVVLVVGEVVRGGRVALPASLVGEPEVGSEPSGLLQGL